MLASSGLHGGTLLPLPTSLPRPLRTRRTLSPASPSCRKLFSEKKEHPCHGLLSSSARRTQVRVLKASEVAEPIEEENSYAPQKYSVKIPVGDRYILVETGHIGRQASASVTVTDGETIVYTSVCLADVPSEPSDFFPMSVFYQEKLSAAGRTSGGFFKREGRAKDHEVLICRLIDRPLRPTMPKGFYHETQILSWVYSYDGIHSPDCLAVTAAGIALALSEVPNSKTVAGVRIGLIGDKFVVNPTTKEMESSELDLILAGTDSAILMIEGFFSFRLNSLSSGGNDAGGECEYRSSERKQREGGELRCIQAACGGSGAEDGEGSAVLQGRIRRRGDQVCEPPQAQGGSGAPSPSLRRAQDWLLLLPFCDPTDDNSHAVGSGGSGIVFRLEIENVTAAVEKALKAGAEVDGEIAEVEGYCGSGLLGNVKDSFGVIWVIASTEKQCSEGEA